MPCLGASDREAGDAAETAKTTMKTPIRVRIAQVGNFIVAEASV